MNKRRIFISIGILILILLVTGATAYYFNYNNTHNTVSKESQTFKSPSSPEDTIKVAGDYQYSIYLLTDISGMTLYHLTRDNGSPTAQSTCLDDCAKLWPPFYAENLKVSDPLKQSDFTSITRPDGKKQLRYKGWPLYYYAGDTKSGDLNGQGIENVWFAGVSLY